MLVPCPFYGRDRIPARTQMFFTCLFNVHKCLQTLKHSIKVFNERMVDDCEDSSKCEKHLCLARVKAGIRWGEALKKIVLKQLAVGTVSKYSKPKTAKKMSRNWPNCKEPISNFITLWYVVAIITA